MPELPEVQSVVNYFKPLLIQEKIHNITSPNGYEKVFDTHSISQINALANSLIINDVFRMGKYIVFDLSNGYLCIHLRMTGQLQMNIDEADNLKHCSFAIFFKSGKSVYFKDYRKFGRLYYYKDLNILNRKLGVEPLSVEFNYDYLLPLMKRSNGMIKPFLLNQKHIAGLGNIYADESLWLSGIHPNSISNKIPKGTVYKLHNSIQHVLNKAIKHNGTTIIDFSYVNGQSGNYANELNIYGKKGLICSNCKTEVIKIKVASRGTYFCRCQKVY